MSRTREIEKCEIEQFHGQKFALALRILRANCVFSSNPRADLKKIRAHELRAVIARYDDVMLGDCDEVILVDRELCERMREIARVFVATHPADGHTLTSFERSYFDAGDALVHVPDLDIFVCPETRHFRQALEDAGYAINHTMRGAKIRAPPGRLDMVRGIPQTIAWIRANPSAMAVSYDAYHAQYLREIQEDSRVIQAYFKSVVLYVHNIVWCRGWPMPASPCYLIAIEGIRFE
jgi:hypothetical protein